MSTREFDYSEHEARLDSIVRRTFASSFMSNSKWRRFFSALACQSPEITHLVWKFVGKEQPIRGASPSEDCLGDRYITRTSFAAFPYKEIEWVEIPGVVALPEQVQAAGLFDTAMTTTGLRVFGYR